MTRAIYRPELVAALAAAPVPMSAELFEKLRGSVDGISRDGRNVIDYKYLDLGELVEPREQRKGTAPTGKMTKAEKKLAKKQRIKGRLLIQEARARVQKFFDES